MAVKILIIGNAADYNLIRFINNLKKYDVHDEIILDVLHNNSPIHYKLSYRLDELTKEIRNLFSVNENQKKSSFLKKINYFINLFKAINSIKNSDYDIVNIHYMSAFYFPLIHLIKKKGKKLLMSPWGSDVYRVNGLNKLLIKRAYLYADYVSFGSIQFRNDVQSNFAIPDSKFVDLSFGSEMIDLIDDNIELDKEDAKVKLNIGGSYTIVCGYNASRAQQHLSIIYALSSIKESLPQNTVLLFPMTYAKDISYISSVKEALGKSSFKNVIFEDYLINSELLYLRKCADIFIHVQVSDAFAATIQEFLLCDTKIINGSWLKYDDLEKWGVPYAVVESIDELGEIVNKVVSGEHNIVISKQLKKNILERGYKFRAAKWINFYKNHADNI